MPLIGKNAFSTEFVGPRRFSCAGYCNYARFEGLRQFSALAKNNCLATKPSQARLANSGTVS